MKKYRLIFAAIIVLTLAPALFLCVKGISYFSSVEGDEVVLSYREFADKVQSGSMSNAEIASRISKIAAGEEKIVQGSGMLKMSLYYWIIVVLAITALQVYLLRILVNTHNKLRQKYEDSEK